MIWRVSRTGMFSLVLCSAALGAEKQTAREVLTEQAVVFGRLISAKSLKCSLGPGYAVEWDTGEPRFEHGTFGSTSEAKTVLFDAIDLAEGRARMIGNSAAGDAAVIATPSGLTFLEKTASGNLMITTVFPFYRKGTKEFIVVHSRHWFALIPLGVLPSQFHGTCKIWDDEGRLKP